MIVACHGKIYNLDNGWTEYRSLKPMEEIKKQRYYRLVYDDDGRKFKWLKIKNALKLKGNSAVCSIGDDRLFVAGYSGVGVYNFVDDKWTKMAKMRCIKAPCRPCIGFDECKQRVYSYIPESENMDIYYFDLMENEWHYHSQFVPLNDNHNNLIWVDNDAVLRIMCHRQIYEFDKYRNLWIENKVKADFLHKSTFDYCGYVFM